MSRTLTYTVPPAWDGRTVKDFARQHLGLSSRAFVKQKYLQMCIRDRAYTVELAARAAVLAAALPALGQLLEYLGEIAAL